MKWSYAELMELPGDLYPELVDWLTETKETFNDMEP
jgi:hypothetical protein